jgi:hypothetical protein
LRIGVARAADVRAALAGFFFVAAMVSPLLTAGKSPAAGENHGGFGGASSGVR